MMVNINYSKSPAISPEEKQLLQAIRANRRYPVCRFELKNSKESSLLSIALDAVHLESKEDSMTQVKARGLVLKSLAEKELIFLNYSLVSYVKSDFEPYHDSQIFALLKETVNQAKEKEGYIFDTAFIEKGIAALTLRGRYAVA